MEPIQSGAKLHHKVIVAALIVGAVAFMLYVLKPSHLEAPVLPEKSPEKIAVAPATSSSTDSGPGVAGK